MTRSTLGSKEPKVSGRGRRSGLDRDTIRKALLNAALDEFLENGFAATRMSDVAVRAGLGKGTAYLHFADKADLFAAAISAVMQGIAVQHPLRRPRFDELTRDFLLRIVPPMLRDLQENGRFRITQLVFAERQNSPELAQVYRMVVITPVLRLVRAYARRAEHRGELLPNTLSRSPIVLAAPVVLSGLWNGLFVWDTPLDVADIFRTHVALLFDEPSSKVKTVEARVAPGSS